MKRKYVLSTDIDNTILYDGYVHPETLRYLNKLSKYFDIVMNTGRRKKSYEKLSLNSDIVCLENGCIIEVYGERDKTWEESIKNGYDKENVYKILKNIFGDKTEKKEYMVIVRYGDLDINDIKTVLQAFELPGAKYTINENTKILEVIPKNTDKGKVLERISYLLKKPLDAFYGIGDSGNDLEMLKTVRKPYTFEHATEEIKELVEKRNGYISPYRSHEGIWDVLDRIYFEVKKYEI